MYGTRVVLILTKTMSAHGVKSKSESQKSPFLSSRSRNTQAAILLEVFVKSTRPRVPNCQQVLNVHKWLFFLNQCFLCVISLKCCLLFAHQSPVVVACSSSVPVEVWGVLPSQSRTGCVQSGVAELLPPPLSCAIVWALCHELFARVAVYNGLKYLAAVTFLIFSD